MESDLVESLVLEFIGSSFALLNERASELTDMSLKKKSYSPRQVLVI